MLALVFLVGFPIVELLLLIQAGAAFGFWPTVGAVVGTAFLGLYLIRQQGMAAIRAAQQDRAAGEVPVAAILTGIRLAFAGILMLLPGFITDAMGLLLLIPGVSTNVISAAAWSGSFRFAQTQSHHSQRYNHGEGGDIVDADYEVVSDPNAASGESSESTQPNETIILPPHDGGKGRRIG